LLADALQLSGPRRERSFTNKMNEAIQYADKQKAELDKPAETSADKFKRVMLESEECLKKSKKLI
jgi:hypothetical protein